MLFWDLVVGFFFGFFYGLDYGEFLVEIRVSMGMGCLFLGVVFEGEVVWFRGSCVLVFFVWWFLNS